MKGAGKGLFVLLQLNAGVFKVNPVFGSIVTLNGCLSFIDIGFGSIGSWTWVGLNVSP